MIFILCEIMIHFVLILDGEWWKSIMRFKKFNVIKTLESKRKVKVLKQIKYYFSESHQLDKVTNNNR